MGFKSRGSGALAAGRSCRAAIQGFPRPLRLPRRGFLGLFCLVRGHGALPQHLRGLADNGEAQTQLRPCLSMLIAAWLQRAEQRKKRGGAKDAKNVPPGGVGLASLGSGLFSSSALRLWVVFSIFFNFFFGGFSLGVLWDL